MRQVIERALSPEQIVATQKTLETSTALARRALRMPRGGRSRSNAIRDFNIAIGELSGTADIIEAGGGRDPPNASPRTRKLARLAVGFGLPLLIMGVAVYAGWSWAHPWSERFSKVRMKEWLTKTDDSGSLDALELFGVLLSQTRNLRTIFSGDSTLHFDADTVRPLCWLAGANWRERPVLTARFRFRSGASQECEIRSFPEADCGLSQEPAYRNLLLI